MRFHTFSLFVTLISSTAAKRGLQDQEILTDAHTDRSGVPFETRAFWMRRAVQALADVNSPCPFQAFGTVIVNHTAGGPLGKEVCIGANALEATGNPVLHGETAAISNCSAILTDPKGAYRLSPLETIEAFRDLSLYTTAEACAMCASAIRWAGFAEYVYATSTAQLKALGWAQMDIPSQYVLDHTLELGPPTRLYGHVLDNETNPLFAWQFNKEAPCPAGCSKDKHNDCRPS